MFKKATKAAVFLKLAVTGPTGSGKTFSALRMARGLVGPQGRIAFVDTENGSASLYSDKFHFDVLDVAPPYEAQKFIDAIEAATKAGYDAVIIDSASHLWQGVLEFKAKLDNRPGSNSYTNWNQAGEKLNAAIASALQSPIHVIACMRSKMDYVLETNSNGKQAPKKVGLAPIMRDGIEYEFTVVFDVDMSHNAATSKDRTELFGDRVFQITETTGAQLDAWRKSTPVVASPAAAPVAEATAAEAPATPTLDRLKPATLDKIRSYAILLKKDDATLEKAAQWASDKRTGEVADLTEDEAQKVCAEFAKQCKTAGEKAPEPSSAPPVEDVPFVFPSDLAFLEPKKAAVLSYLRKIRWIGEADGLDKLPPEKCKLIVDKRANFERALADHEAELATK